MPKYEKNLLDYSARELFNREEIDKRIYDPTFNVSVEADREIIERILEKPIFNQISKEETVATRAVYFLLIERVQKSDYPNFNTTEDILNMDEEEKAKLITFMAKVIIIWRERSSNKDNQDMVTSDEKMSEYDRIEQVFEKEGIDKELLKSRNLNLEIGNDTPYIEMCRQITSLGHKKFIVLTHRILDMWQEEYDGNIYDSDELIVKALTYSSCTINHLKWIKKGLYDKKMKRYLEVTCLYIDDSYLFNILKPKYPKINLRGIKPAIGKLIESFIKEATMCVEPEGYKFLSAAMKNAYKNNGINIKHELKDPEGYWDEYNKHYNGRPREKVEADDLIIERLLEIKNLEIKNNASFSKNIKIAILSGDSDFFPFIKVLSEEGIKVKIIAKRENMSSEYLEKIQSAYNIEFINLDYETLEKLGYKDNTNGVTKTLSKEYSNESQVDTNEKETALIRKKVKIIMTGNEIPQDFDEFINNLTGDIEIVFEK